MLCLFPPAPSFSRPLFRSLLSDVPRQHPTITARLSDGSHETKGRPCENAPSEQSISRIFRAEAPTVSFYLATPAASLFLEPRDKCPAADGDASESSNGDEQRIGMTLAPGWRTPTMTRRLKTATRIRRSSSGRVSPPEVRARVGIQVAIRRSRSVSSRLTAASADVEGASEGADYFARRRCSPRKSAGINCYLLAYRSSSETRGSDGT